MDPIFAANFFQLRPDYVKNISGDWTLTIENPGEETASIPIGGWVRGASLTMSVQVQPIPSTHRLQITAELMSDGQAVENADISAFVSSLSGPRTAWDILDHDGSADAVAGDGLYRGATGELGPGEYLVAVKANGAGVRRYATASIEISSVPVMSIHQDGGQIEISWSISEGQTEYELEQALDLVTPVNWTPVDTVPVSEGSVRSVRLPIINETGHFHLKQQL